MNNEIDPLKITIAKSKWAMVEENKPYLEWLRKNYNLLRVDDDNKKAVRYLYQHINRPGITITVDVNGNITDGYLDATDYLFEAEKVKEITMLMAENEKEEPFDQFFEEDDDDWEEEEDYFNNDKYIIGYISEDGEKVTVTPEENKIEQLSKALWVINKQAKAYRDNLKFNYSDFSPACQEYFEVMLDNYYRMKAYAFKKLHKDNKLSYEGIHIGKDGKTQYPYVKFGGRGFHLAAKGTYFEALKKKKPHIIRTPLPKIESIDHSLRNDRQADLSRAERIVCEFLQPGMYDELWFKIENEKKRITRDARSGKIRLVE
ncbi:hypothetical protein RCG23_03510 [Neobacillus sp. PS3-34]|uniref:hypothetical protein n=1 Tax=Neobacillus sp. PS3-34 TaxID=3070678 RepID=UPI0027E16DFD|nr:hypothetical protein [Neobacillus sp. PS3-34]WML49172.1 hypothetical protein RCG23_03510 [Neobacillus sp. PS3-34]